MTNFFLKLYLGTTVHISSKVKSFLLHILPFKYMLHAIMDININAQF